MCDGGSVRDIGREAVEVRKAVEDIWDCHRLQLWGKLFSTSATKTYVVHALLLIVANLPRSTEDELKIFLKDLVERSQCDESRSSRSLSPSEVPVSIVQNRFSAALMARGVSPGVGLLQKWGLPHTRFMG